MDINVPVAEQVIITDNLQPSRTNYKMFLTTAKVLQRVSHIFNQAATAIRGGLAALGRHWTYYYPRVAFGEEGVIMPHSTLTFIVNALLALVAIKSQGQPGFPLYTQPQLIMFSVKSLLMYGLASAVEIVFFAGGLDHTSIYVIIARLGRIGSLYVLVASLSSMFYF